MKIYCLLNTWMKFKEVLQFAKEGKWVICFYMGFRTPLQIILWPLTIDCPIYISCAGRRDVSRHAAVALIFFMDVLIIRVSLIPV